MRATPRRTISALAMICAICRAENETNIMVCESCGHDLAAATGLRVGSVIDGRYELMAVVGKGGMGVVFKARDRLLDDVVALKVLREDVRLAHEGTHRFRSEIKLARRVSHRNVCRIHEYGEHGGLRYLSMAFVEGVDLKQSIARQGPPPAAEALEMAVAMAEAVAAIHAEGIVHRDLKTSNVMRDAEGEIRVMDFGVAKDRRTEVVGTTMAGQIIGTAEYMSPEQAQGGAVDFRSDVYSLGVIVFELFTGRLPFQGDNAVSTMLMQIHSPAPLDGPAVGDMPPALASVLRRALAKAPSDRFASAAELATALRALREDGGAGFPALSGSPAASPNPPALGGTGPSWFYADGAQRRGPVDTNGLVTLLLARPDPRRVRIWREGMAAWQDAGSVAGLDAILPPPLEPGDARRPLSSEVRSSAENVRRLYRQLLLLLLIQVLTGVLLWTIPTPGTNGTEPSVFEAITFLGYTFGLLLGIPATTYHLTKQLAARVPALWAVAMVVPVVNVVLLAGLGARIEQWCRERGLQPGLLGPT